MPLRRMKLTIHRGSREIGGSCVEIATESTRIILDVGLPLEPPSDLFSARKPIRPHVPGLFGPGPHIDAILLSHAHGDHSGLIAESRPEIPVWLSRGTSKMLMAGTIFARQSEVPCDRQRICRPGRTFRVGDLRVTPFNVDHSTFDALAFLVEGEGQRLLYSGDLRLHGRKPGMARQLVRRISAEPLDALIMEGTHLGSGRPARGMSEQEMTAEAIKLVASTRGIVLAMFSPLNLDRLVSYFKVALKRSGLWSSILTRHSCCTSCAVKQRCPIPSHTNAFASRCRLGSGLPARDDVWRQNSRRR